MEQKKKETALRRKLTAIAIQAYIKEQKIIIKYPNFIDK